MSLTKTNPLVKPGRKFAYQQIGISVIIVLFCTLIAYVFWGLAHAQSVLAGGVIAIIPNCVFAYKAFKYAGAQSSKLVVNSFFSGVKLKMLIMAILLVFAFKLLVILPIAFFGTFSLVMALPLFTPFFLKH
ncbi:MAG: ATP synthase subunit I [Colwellia sp.]|nr:ATP synthase subunit I [Colwellia sp.]